MNKWTSNNFGAFLLTIFLASTSSVFAQSNIAAGESSLACSSLFNIHKLCINNVDGQGSTQFCKNVITQWNSYNCPVVMQGISSLSQYKYNQAFQYCITSGRSGLPPAEAQIYCKAFAEGAANSGGM